MTKRINQYYPSWQALPEPGEIRELVDRRSGKVSKLARVQNVNPHSRTASLELVNLDRNGRERTK